MEYFLVLDEENDFVPLRPKRQARRKRRKQISFGHTALVLFYTHVQHA